MKGIALLIITCALVISCSSSQKAGDETPPQDVSDEDSSAPDVQPDFTPADFQYDELQAEIPQDIALEDFTGDIQDIKIEEKAETADAEDAADLQQDAGDDCQKLFTSYFDEAAKLDFCYAPGQCKHINSDICAQYKGCAGFFINESAGTTKLEQIAFMYKSLGCPVIDETCECPAIDFVASGCYQGKCQPCGYICNMDCACKKDIFGCDLPECEEEDCFDVIGKIDSEIEKLKGCGGTFDCSLFEYPICGTAGCFQAAVSKQGDYSDLFELAEQATQLQCAGFTCGCGYAGMPICVDG
ncbi:MAG: hypothetical protein FJ088_04430, partial [Deltaproteobacteria bacterium]|nr:hypothetical protein [Deltaproteobacteria bacterium]